MSNHEYELIVVGAGPAGIAAATMAAESGRRVALLEDAPWLGGQIWRGQPKQTARSEPGIWFERLLRSGANVLNTATVFAFPQPGSLLAQNNDQTLELTWEQMILATGARELFLPFPGWTLPGVIGPGGLQALIKNGWPIDGRRVVVAGSGPLLPVVAESVASHGGEVVCVAEQAPRTRLVKFGLGLWRYPGKWRQAAGLGWSLRGIRYRFGVWPVRAEGAGRVEAVTLTNGNRTWTEKCQVLACGFGLVPNLELALAAGCQCSQGVVEVDDFLASSVAGVYCVGELTGVAGAESALVQGHIAGYAAAGERSRAERLFAQAARWRRFRSALNSAFALRPELRGLADDETIFCRCEDVPLGRIGQFRSWREAKLQTRCGMGPCQGRICGTSAEFLWGWRNDSVRPPILPVQVKNLISTQTPEHLAHNETQPA